MKSYYCNYESSDYAVMHCDHYALGKVECVLCLSDIGESEMAHIKSVIQTYIAQSLPATNAIRFPECSGSHILAFPQYNGSHIVAVSSAR